MPGCATYKLQVTEFSFNHLRFPNVGLLGVNRPDEQGHTTVTPTAPEIRVRVRKETQDSPGSVGRSLAAWGHPTFCSRTENLLIKS